MASTPQETIANQTHTNGHHNGLVDQDPISEAGKRVSEEEYWANYYEHPDFSYEWNNGILEEKPQPNFFNVQAYRWFLILLDTYLRNNPVGYLMHLETGVRFQISQGDTKIRKPDAFIVHHDNPNPLGKADHFYHGICDLCVESLSDFTEDEIKRDVETKFKEYELAGIKEYFILDAKSRENTAFYRLSPNGKYQKIVTENQDIIDSKVLPGFQFRISDFFKTPSIMALAEDEVYQGYVMLEYQESQRRVEEKRQRADEERQRAEEERQRAEDAEKDKARMAAKLRELGIDPDSL